MKTAISIPDPVFEQAERIAKELSLSRSELYAKAVETFISQHQSADVTEKLNQLYADESSAVDPVLLELQASSVARKPW
jgi:metal-responsive CopG/Arc/MetJ family transcriptional regulator